MSLPTVTYNQSDINVPSLCVAPRRTSNSAVEKESANAVVRTVAGVC